jgi:hypothetical protein
MLIQITDSHSRCHFNKHGRLHPTFLYNIQIKNDLATELYTFNYVFSEADSKLQNQELSLIMCLPCR